MLKVGMEIYDIYIYIYCVVLTMQDLCAPNAMNSI